MVFVDIRRSETLAFPSAGSRPAHPTEHMSGSELHDVHLLGRVAAGDREAFAELFDTHSPLVLGVLVRMLGNRAEAEDVLQEAFLQAWRQADRYDPERATPRGWLLTLARSRALDGLRSDKARQRREETVWLDDETSSSEPVGTRHLEQNERRIPNFTGS